MFPSQTPLFVDSNFSVTKWWRFPGEGCGSALLELGTQNALPLVAATASNQDSELERT